MELKAWVRELTELADDVDFPALCDDTRRLVATKYRVFWSLSPACKFAHVRPVTTVQARDVEFVTCSCLGCIRADVGERALVAAALAYVRNVAGLDRHSRRWWNLPAPYNAQRLAWLVTARVPEFCLTAPSLTDAVRPTLQKLQGDLADRASGNPVWSRWASQVVTAANGPHDPVTEWRTERADQRMLRRLTGRTFPMPAAVPDHGPGAGDSRGSGGDAWWCMLPALIPPVTSLPQLLGKDPDGVACAALLSARAWRHLMISGEPVVAVLLPAELAVTVTVSLVDCVAGPASAGDDDLLLELAWRAGEQARLDPVDVPAQGTALFASVRTALDRAT